MADDSASRRRLAPLGDPFSSDKGPAVEERRGSALFDLPPLPVPQPAEQTQADADGEVEEPPQPAPAAPVVDEAPPDTAIFRFDERSDRLSLGGLSSPILDRPRPDPRPEEVKTHKPQSFSFDGGPSTPLFGLGVLDDLSRAPLFRGPEDEIAEEPEPEAAAAPLPRPVQPASPRERLSRARERRRSGRQPAAGPAAGTPPAAPAQPPRPQAPPQAAQWDGLDATMPIGGAGAQQAHAPAEQWDGLDVTMPVQTPGSASQQPAQERWDGLDVTMPVQTPGSAGQPPAQEQWDGLDVTMPVQTPGSASQQPAQEQWDGLDVTMPVQTPGSASQAPTQEQWDGLDVTMPVQTPGSASQQPAQEQWDGLDVTMPVQTPGSASQPPAQEQWDGLDATIPATDHDSGLGSDSALRPPTAATMRPSPPSQVTDPTMPATDSPTDPTIAQGPGSGTRIREITNATMIAGDPEATAHTLVPGEGARKGTGVTSVAFDAAWHMAGRKGPATGQVWGDYEIGGVLGEGGMGLVYRARQLSLERKCAVKVLAPHLAVDDSLRERFELEARATSILRSANIVAVYTAGNIAGQPYFVMEFVDGSDLGDEVKKRNKEGAKFTIEEAIDYVLQAARGLSEAGNHHIVHRDIKPSNLMLTRDGVIKLTDFGIVKIKGESNLTLTGQAMGTPAYVSPEQGRGEEVDERSDLYSLGVVLYELLTMQKPFTGTTPDALIYQHSYDEPKLPKEINPEVGDDIQAVVIKLMAKKRENRYDSARDLVRDLEDLSEGKRLEKLLAQKLSTGGAEALRENQTWLQRHGIVAMGSIAAAMILVIGGIVWWWQAQAEQRQAAQNASAQVASLRTSLAVLDAQVGLYEGVESDLQQLRQTLDLYPSLANADEQERLARWREKIARNARLREQLAGLAEDVEPSYQQLTDWQDAYGRLHSDVGGDARGMAQWNAALTTIQTRIDEMGQTLLGELAVEPAQLSIAQREAAVARRDRLAAMVAPDNARLASIDSSIEAHRLFVAELAERLDTFLARDPAEDRAALLAAIESDLTTAAAVYPDNDDQLAGWRQALAPVIDDWHRAQRSATRLDTNPEPHSVNRRRIEPMRQDIARLLELGDISANQGRTYVEQLDNIEAFWASIQRAMDERKPLLAGLDRAEPITLEQRIGLDDLSTVLENIVDDDLQRWRTKVANVDRLSAELADLPQRFFVDNLEERHATLKQLQALVGPDDQAVKTAAERIDLLYGPPVPAWASSSGRDRFGLWAVLRLDEDQALRFRYVMPGQARIGSPDWEQGREVDEEQIDIGITDGFWIADTECTRGFYRSVTGEDPSRHSSHEHSIQRPVDRVSRADTAAFFKRLRETRNTLPIRLPTEFEWEYACRAGSNGSYAVLEEQGEGSLEMEGIVEQSVDAFAWYVGNSDASSRPVGKLRPNPIGLFDMHGNVWEWCNNPYGPYSVEGLTAMQRDDADRWVARGGSWGDEAVALRAANRLAVKGSMRSAYLGFRPVIDCSWPQDPDGSRIITTDAQPTDIITSDDAPGAP